MLAPTWTQFASNLASKSFANQTHIDQKNLLIVLLIFANLCDYFLNWFLTHLVGKTFFRNTFFNFIKELPVYEYPWVSTNTYGHPWGHRGIHRLTWLPMGTNASGNAFLLEPSKSFKFLESSESWESYMTPQNHYRVLVVRNHQNHQSHWNPWHMWNPTNLSSASSESWEIIGNIKDCYSVESSQSSEPSTHFVSSELLKYCEVLGIA